MKPVATICFTLLLAVRFLPADAQNYSSRSKKAVRKMEEARECLSRYDYDCVEEALNKAIRTDPGFVEAYRLLAQVMYDQGRLEEAIETFSTSLEVDPEDHPEGYRLLAGLTLRTGDYQRTLDLIQKYLSFPPEEVNNRDQGLLLKQDCLFALDAVKHPVPFNPEGLGPAINSDYNEYWPVMSMDGSFLMFTVMVPRDPGGARIASNLQEDFYYAEKSGKGWNERINAGKPLNTPDNEGAHTMMPDGNVIYFTACNRRDGLGMCDIYRSHMEDGMWSTPVNLGSPLNSRFSEKHPSISADGRRLYFASNRPGGKGGYDIWVSVKEDGRWGEPVNLGDSVNTPGLEQSPFIHADQRTLYFSSDGWPGMGQGDLFLTRMNAGGTWSHPVNLGYPVNTYHDEFGLSVDAAGNRAFFASDRGSGNNTDLFTFELPEKAKPIPASYMKGRVFDARTMKGLKAVVQLIDVDTEERVMELESNPGEGDFLISLPAERDYALNVSAGGYLFYSEHFSFRGIHSASEPFRREIPLEPISVGNRVVLNNIFFGTDSDSLLPTSIAELDKVYEFLARNPSVGVEISGHTDNTGSRVHNQELSEKRADAVVKYLRTKGIPPQKLVAAGYGESQPVAGNDTAEGRALNRRTELKIIEVLIRSEKNRTE